MSLVTIFVIVFLFGVSYLRLQELYTGPTNLGETSTDTTLAITRLLVIYLPLSMNLAWTAHITMMDTLAFAHNLGFYPSCSLLSVLLPVLMCVLGFAALIFYKDIVFAGVVTWVLFGVAINTTTLAIRITCSALGAVLTVISLVIVVKRVWTGATFRKAEAEDLLFFPYTFADERID